MRAHTHWRWRLDEVYVKINGEMRYLWRAVDREGRGAGIPCYQDARQGDGFEIIKKPMKHHGRPQVIVTDGLRAALRGIGNVDRQETGRWLNNLAYATKAS